MGCRGRSVKTVQAPAMSPGAEQTSPPPRGSSVDVRAARVGPLREIGGVRMRLDHGVFRVLLDLMLELGDHMAGRDDEAPRVETYGFVLIATKRDESIAAELPALAAERDDAIGRLGVDAFVERAQGRLAACDAPRVQLNADGVAEEIHCLHICSRLAAAPRGAALVYIHGQARPKYRKGPHLRAFAFIGETGFEPATARPPAGCATRLRHSPWCSSSERATGIEPALRAWKAPVQPQHFARKAPVKRT